MYKRQLCHIAAITVRSVSVHDRLTVCLQAVKSASGFGNEMKITLFANIFRFLLQKFSFSFVLFVEILVFISFSFF